MCVSVQAQQGKVVIVGERYIGVDCPLFQFFCGFKIFLNKKLGNHFKELQSKSEAKKTIRRLL